MKEPKYPKYIEESIDDKTRLLLRFNFVSSILSLFIGLLSLFILQIKTPIPEVFFTYFVLNLLNVLGFKKHQNLTAMALITSLLSFLSTLIIALYSGGINSPFIFVLAIIVLAGYISKRRFGQIYLYTIIAVVFLLYFMAGLEKNIFYDAVGKSSKDHFSLISMLFAIYLLGGVFGRNLLKSHHKLYRSKAEIEERIHEKETLLREVHHRVKNNLQTVSSLLNLQSKNTEETSVKSLIKSSQNRVNSMAMIHEMLYMHDNITKIDYGPYTRELCEYLINSLKGNSSNIDLHIDMDQIKLGIDTSIPLGLLINEVVTNALKYGIPNDEKGEIKIAMREKEPNTYILKISDDGIGFAESMDAFKTKTLGLKLITNLAKQLRGSVEKDSSKKGTAYTIHFQDIDKD